MAQLQSAKLERRVIRTITSSSKKAASKLFGSLRPECFFSSAGKQSYARILAMLQQRGDLLTWDELTVDLALSENARQQLLKEKVRVIPDDQIDKAVKTLHRYRRARALANLSEFMVKELLKDSVDIDDLEQKVGEMLVSAKKGGDQSKWFTNFGVKGDKSGERMVRQVLKEDKDRFIPTGFKTFDTVLRNRGLPRGRASMMASTSGGGKSLLAAGQIAHNVASQGARVCVVPLEMDSPEMTQRHISRLTETDMSKVIDPKLFNDRDIERIVKANRQWEREIESKGGSLTYFTPDEDMTLEEILFLLRPLKFDLIVIDYIGLLKGVQGDDQWRALNNATRFGHRFAAMDGEVHICFCAQLTDAGDLASAKGMKRDMAVMWAWVVGEKERETGIVYIDQVKCRHGAAVKFPLRINWKTMTVTDLEEGELEQVRKAGAKAHKDRKEKREERRNNSRGSSNSKRDDGSRHRQANGDRKIKKKPKEDGYFSFDE